MHSLSIDVLACLSLTITIASQRVIRGEKTRYTIDCPLREALWYGPPNQSMLTNSNKYEIKYAFGSLQLTINHLTSDDEGEYICQKNHTEQIIRRYDLQLATMTNVLPLFFALSAAILLLMPAFCMLGRKYSGMHQ